MGVQRYVLTADVTVPQGTLETTPGEFGTEGTTAGYGVFPDGTFFQEGTAIELDPDSELYSALSAHLRAWVPGQDDVGHGGLAN